MEIRKTPGRSDRLHGASERPRRFLGSRPRTNRPKSFKLVVKESTLYEVNSNDFVVVVVVVKKRSLQIQVKNYKRGYHVTWISTVLITVL